MFTIKELTIITPDSKDIHITNGRWDTNRCIGLEAYLAETPDLTSGLPRVWSGVSAKYAESPIQRFVSHRPLVMCLLYAFILCLRVKFVPSKPLVRSGVSAKYAESYSGIRNRIPLSGIQGSVFHSKNTRENTRYQREAYNKMWINVLYINLPCDYMYLSDDLIWNIYNDQWLTIYLLSYKFHQAYASATLRWTIYQISEINIVC